MRSGHGGEKSALAQPGDSEIEIGILHATPYFIDFSFIDFSKLDYLRFRIAGSNVELDY